MAAGHVWGHATAMWAMYYSVAGRLVRGARRAARPVGSLKSASVQANVGLAAEAAVADPKGRQDPASFEELQNFCEKRFNRK